MTIVTTRVRRKAVATAALLSVLTGGAVAANIASAPRASAWTTFSCHFPAGVQTRTIATVTGTPAIYQDAVTHAAKAWNEAGSPVTLVVVPPGAAADIVAETYTDPSGPYAYVSACNSDPHPHIYINRDPLDWAKPEFIDPIVAHEVGHALGLGHESLGTCATVMTPGIGSEGCPSGPQPDDIIGLRAIYGVPEPALFPDRSVIRDLINGRILSEQGAQVVDARPIGQKSQLWSFLPYQSDEVGWIVNASSGWCLGVDDLNRDPQVFAPVMQQPCDHQNVGQYWRINARSDGTRTLENLATGKLLDIKYAASDNNAEMGVYGPNSGLNQGWHIG